jgi:hypothetical protein
MKKDKIDYNIIDITDYLFPSIQLRWLEEDFECGYNGGFKKEKVLQQLFQSSLGKS